MAPFFYKSRESLHLNLFIDSCQTCPILCLHSSLCSMTVFSHLYHNLMRDALVKISNCLMIHLKAYFLPS